MYVFKAVLRPSTGRKWLTVQPLSRMYSTDMVDETDEFFKERAAVYATGISIKPRGGKPIGRIGTYWGRNDPLNTYQKIDDDINMARVQIEAVSFALRQAIYEKKIDGVIVKTDSQFVEKVVNRYLQYWRANNFHKADGTPVKNRKEIEELDRLLHGINAEVQYSSFEKDGKNILLAYLQEDGVMNEDLNQLRAGVIQSEPAELSTASPSVDFDPNAPLPVIYVSGSHSKSGNNNFFVAGYGVHWSDGSSTDRCERFAQIPVTLYRAQLCGIISALEEAIEKGLRQVEIVTDSPLFLAHYKAGWLKANGEPIANYYFYKCIVALTEKIAVKFKYVPEALHDSNMERAKQLAIDGMAYPIPRKPQASEFPEELVQQI